MQNVQPAKLLNAEDMEHTITTKDDPYKLKELSHYPKGLCVNTQPSM
jgi:hypothetical protein